MTDATAPCNVEFEHGGEFRVRVRRPYSQEFKISLVDAPTVIMAIINAVPRDAHGAVLIDQIVAAVRARRPHDRTNTERQRRFRQRRRAQRLNADSIGKESVPV
jgi:hypothetical protein